MKRRRLTEMLVTLVTVPAVMRGTAAAEDNHGMELQGDGFRALEAQFGGPGSGGLGSAVFHLANISAVELEQQAQRVYRTFAGEMWNRWGEAK